MKKILIFLLVIISFNVSAQVKADTAQRKSQNAISGLSSKVPGLLVPAVRDSNHMTTGYSHSSDKPRGLLIIDDKEVPYDSVISLKVENIEDIRVLNLAEKHALYGTKGDPYSAVIFITKKYAAQKSKESKEIKKP